ncbi:hypothetical protein AVEN_117128-1 [Araneus ventricosus]|uniref:Uncharacterized protein n=1 Tax=Araneus ventricosus TaxID=182803 RepID=A0A4Y2S1Z4_ARAVE|nr:hypothetical protein AVEN_251068-1 [Araneus ventricosus]GBN74126.1 hypothetical protein AVEN_5660-1 [Araneus ventricosus]GBN81250.1 hypothetical protein AVEN_74186-1 [Araneus ventricosus]GBN81296.1 hypothetical protein AVEN_117128-1 [Araneus ventricosus]
MSVCEHDNSKTVRATVMKFGVWSLNIICRFLTNFGQNPSTGSLPVYEATFHVGNKVNTSTTAEFGAQKIPMQYRKWKETVQKSMCCALLHDTVIGQFSFAETSVTANIYLGILQIYAILQMQHLQLTVIFQQDDGARVFEQFAGTGLPAGYPQGY